MESTNSNYEKYKDTIYRWRNLNKEKYLLNQCKNYERRIQEPGYRELERERLKKIRLEKMNNDIQNGIVKRPVGRPRKYT